MRSNKTLAAWREGKQTVGGWLSLGNTHTAETMASLGFDWLCIDLQHGLLDYKDLTVMLPAISTTGVTPLVRVPWNEPYEIMKALDAGAYGVIVPMVNNREEAEQAVAACRYPPGGNRSFGPIRAALYGGGGYAQHANDEIACVAMIETAEGIDQVDEVAATTGLDGIYIGPSDLALAIGLQPTGDNDQPEHTATVQKVQDACNRHGVAAGIHTSSLAYAQRYLELGFHFVTLGSDLRFMLRAATEDLAAVRQTAPGAREETGY